MLLYALLGAVLGEPTLSGPSLATIVVLVAAVNAALAPVAVRAMAWAKTDDRDRRHTLLRTMTSDNSRHRLGLLAVAALSLFGALFARLWFLQVVEGDTAARSRPPATPPSRSSPRRPAAASSTATAWCWSTTASRSSSASTPRSSASSPRRHAGLGAEAAVHARSAPASRSRSRSSVEDLEQEAQRLAATPSFRPIPVAEDISGRGRDLLLRAGRAGTPSVVVERTTVRSLPLRLARRPRARATSAR